MFNQSIQVSPNPKPSAATKRTLADRSPPFIPTDLAHHPTDKPKYNMDIANITNPTIATTLTSEPGFHFGPVTAPNRALIKKDKN
ncbi:hypothetical protein G6F62_012655 [Rhizopus arrhizus]|nr:hypothetical protein G6F62_012655 [Rhizopus arrhizus]